MHQHYAVKAIAVCLSLFCVAGYPYCSDTTRAAKLRDWLLAPQGQKVVSESGYVPIRKP